jgi:hypothetical protein
MIIITGGGTFGTSTATTNVDPTTTVIMTTTGTTIMTGTITKKTWASYL